MTPDDFKNQYLNDMPGREPVVVAVGSFSQACYAAHQKGINRRTGMRYLHRIEQVRSMDADWKRGPNPPELLCIHYSLWDEAKRRGIVADDTQ